MKQLALFKSKKSISDTTIVSIDPFKKVVFLFNNGRMQQKDLLGLSKDSGYVISYIKHKDIAVANINVGTGLIADELESVIHQRAYTDLGLDENNDYVIKFRELDDNGFYSVFALNSQVAGDANSQILEKTKYIDYVAFAPLLFGSLYDNHVLTPNNVDCFIYFQEDDAFLAVYRDGKYLQSRSLGRYNLNYIKNKLQEACGEKIHYKDFCSTFKTDGVKNENKDLAQILEDVFYYASDILSNISKQTNIVVQNIYVSTEVGNIPGLATFVQDRLLIQTFDFNFNINVAQKAMDESWLHLLMFLTARADINGLVKSKFNFSSCLRPPEFLKRDGGKFIASACVALVLGLAYPCYEFAHGLFLQYQTNNINEEIEIKTAKINELKAQLNTVKAEFDGIKKQVDIQKAELDQKENLLTATHDKKTNYAMKGVVLYDLSNFINQVDVRARNIGIKDRNVVLSLISNDDTPITQLIKNINNSSKYSVSTRQIALKSGRFESNITVEIR